MQVQASNASEPAQQKSLQATRSRPARVDRVVIRASISRRRNALSSCLSTRICWRRRWSALVSEAIIRSSRAASRSSSRILASTAERNRGLTSIGSCSASRIGSRPINLALKLRPEWPQVFNATADDSDERALTRYHCGTHVRNFQHCRVSFCGNINKSAANFRYSSIDLSPARLFAFNRNSVSGIEPWSPLPRARTLTASAAASLSPITST